MARRTHTSVDRNALAALLQSRMGLLCTLFGGAENASTENASTENASTMQLVLYVASKCTAELSDRRSGCEVDANIQAVPPSEVFSVPRKNCWPAHISKRVPVIRAATSLASVGSIAIVVYGVCT